MQKWDFKSLSTSKYVTNNYQISEDFTSIAMNTDTADIVFVPSKDGTCSVECVEEEKIKHTVAVEDGVLTVKVVDTRKWYEHIGIHFGSPKLTVALPKAEYADLLIEESTGDIKLPKDFSFAHIGIFISTGDVHCSASATESMKIETSTGKIRVESLSAASLDLSVTTGNVTVTDVTCAGDISVEVTTGKANLTNVTCASLVSEGDTGDITLKNVIASAKFSIERDTGDVRFEGADAAEIAVKTDTGDVKGSLLTEKVFIVNTDTGRKEYPNTTSGGRCQITTDTGNVKITLAQ